MDDLISRAAVLDYIDNMPFEMTKDGRYMVRRIRLTEYISDTLPSAQERKKGKWIDGQDMPEYPRIPYRIGEKYCSECRNEAMRDGYDEQQLTEFCPNCGAEMRGEEDEQNNEGHLRLVRQGDYEHRLSDNDFPQICGHQPRKGV